MNTELLAIIISVLAVLIIPALALLVRISVKWQRLEDGLSDIDEDVKQLVKEKSDANRELYNLIKTGLEAIDKRVRWLEQNIWNRRKRE